MSVVLSFRERMSVTSSRWKEAAKCTLLVPRAAFISWSNAPALQSFGEVLEFSLLQFRPARIFGDVAPEIVKLRQRPDQMIKTVLLPKTPLAADNLVDLCRRETLPRFALSKHQIFSWKSNQPVHMIRHDDEVHYFVAVAVKMHQLSATIWGSSTCRSTHAPWQLSKCSFHRLEI